MVLYYGNPSKLIEIIKCNTAMKSLYGFFFCEHFYRFLLEIFSHMKLCENLCESLCMISISKCHQSGFESGCIDLHSSCNV